MSMIFNDILTGFEEFANLTNNDDLFNKIQSIKSDSLTESIDDEILNFKRDIESCDNLDDIENLITDLSDGVLEDILMISFNDAKSNKKSLDEIKDIILTDLDNELDDNEDYYNKITNESCTSDNCDYTNDGKNDVIKTYEIIMDGKVQERIAGTEQDVINRINDYKSQDDANKQMFIINGLEMPVYTYRVVDKDDVTDDLKFDVDEDFRFRESNNIIG